MSDTTTDSADRPLVSVMMPAKNAGRYLEATVRSVQAQTYTHWELMFVDDGSDDNTLEVIRSLAADDPRIRVHAMSHGGRGRARNACVERMTGKYVAVCDSDDLSFPDRFEKQVAYLESHPDIGAVAAWWVPFSTEMPTVASPVRTFPTEPEDLRDAFARGKMRFHNATAMIRTSLFREHGAYNVELRRAQDYEFFSRLSRRGVLFAALPEPLLYYRQEADTPSLKYFRENGMYMAYADRVLGGRRETFQVFADSLAGRLWKAYYSVKYLYFTAKLESLRIMGR
jgi:glycosyltransferase involved in cell wall biosynthesis